MTVDVVTPRRDERSPKNETFKGVKVTRIDGPWNRYRWSILWMMLIELFWLVRGWRKYDVVFFFSIGTEIYLPIIIARLLGLLTVARISMLGQDDLGAVARTSFGGARLWSLGWADAIVCPTSQVQQVSECAIEAFKKNGLPRCVLIPNGVDTAHFAPPADRNQRRHLRQRFNIPEKSFTAIFVGYIHPRKNVEYLIKEWAVVHRQLGVTQLLLVGPRHLQHVGEANEGYLGVLDQLVEDLGLSQVVQWIETRDVAPYLRASDVFLFSSLQEGFPNALLEALSAELPLFVVRREWLPSGLISHGETGFIVGERPGNLSSSILEALRMSDLEAVGRRGRESVVSRFAIEVTSDTYQSFFRERLSSGENRNR